MAGMDEGRGISPIEELFLLAKESTGEEGIEEIAKILAERLVKSFPATTLGDSRLKPKSKKGKGEYVILVTEEAENTFEEKKEGLDADVNSRDEKRKKDLILGGINNPEIFDTHEKAMNKATDLYPTASPQYREMVVIQWADEFNFKNKGDDWHSLGDLTDELFRENTNLQEKIVGLLEISSDASSSKIRRQSHQSASDFVSVVRSARKQALEDRWEWLDENLKITEGSGGEVGLDYQGRIPSNSPGIVGFEPEVNFWLLERLLEVMKAELTPISVVLCKSQKWRSEQLGEGGERCSLNGSGIIGCREGDDLHQIATGMVENQFDVQPIFNSKGNRVIGSLELKKIVGIVAGRGVSVLPKEVDRSELEELGLWGPKLPQVDPMQDVETAAMLLQRQIDGVLFVWSEDTYSHRLPEDCQGTLEDGFHIVTSHDILAFGLIR
jgi:hypothetical protein